MDRLIKKITQGDTRAQSQFYDEYSPLVMGICMRYMRDSAMAADVFQESFIKIFEKIHQVKDAAALKGWIRKIAVNTSLDHLRSHRFTEPLEAEALELNDQFYADLLDKLSNEAIINAMNRLPDGYRIIFNLHIIDGYSHREIAEQLQIAESTSRSQLSHARRLLKVYLHQIGITRYEQVI